MSIRITIVQLEASSYFSLILKDMIVVLASDYLM
jgi:hypothetical protein